MIGLIDVDGKIPNLALMKISTHYKNLGEKVEFVDINNPSKYEKVYASCLFTWNRDKCLELQERFGDKLQIGGTGWDFKEINRQLIQVNCSELPKEIGLAKPDYDLYSKEFIYQRICRGIGKKESKLKKAETIANMGIGFTSRGCIRQCGFCIVHKKEGKLREEAEIKDIINPRSNIIILHDNNLTADPLVIDKLHEIRDRGLKVDINQGCDIRLMNEDIAEAMSGVKHLRSIHYAWDLMGFENQVFEGIKTLSKHIKPYRHMCFMLVGFNTSFDEDMYRFRKLREYKVDPFVMVYNQKQDIKLKHFARWVNSRIYKACEWKNYEPWIKAQLKGQQLSLFDIAN